MLFSGLYIFTSLQLMNQILLDVPDVMAWGLVVLILLMQVTLMISFFILAWDIGMTRGKIIPEPFHVLGNPYTHHKTYHFCPTLLFGIFMFRKRYRWSINLLYKGILLSHLHNSTVWTK